MGSDGKFCLPKAVLLGGMRLPRFRTINTISDCAKIMEA